MAWVRAGSPASSAMITRTGCPARPPWALTYDDQARMAGGTVPVTAPRIPDPAPNDPSRISDFGPAAASGVAACPAPAAAVAPAAAAPGVPVCRVRTPFAASNSPVGRREPQAVATRAEARRPIISGRHRLFIASAPLGEACAPI